MLLNIQQESFFFFLNLKCTLPHIWMIQPRLSIMPSVGNNGLVSCLPVFCVSTSLLSSPNPLAFFNPKPFPPHLPPPPHTLLPASYHWPLSHLWPAARGPGQKIWILGQEVRHIQREKYLCTYLRDVFPIRLSKIAPRPWPHWRGCSNRRRTFIGKHKPVLDMVYLGGGGSNKIFNLARVSFMWLRGQTQMIHKIGQLFNIQRDQFYTRKHNRKLGSGELEDVGWNFKSRVNKIPWRQQLSKGLTRKRDEPLGHALPLTCPGQFPLPLGSWSNYLRKTDRPSTMKLWGFSCHCYPLLLHKVKNNALMNEWRPETCLLISWSETPHSPQSIISPMT